MRRRGKHRPWQARQANKGEGQHTVWPNADRGTLCVGGGGGNDPTLRDGGVGGRRTAGDSVGILHDSIRWLAPRPHYQNGDFGWSTRIILFSHPRGTADVTLSLKAIGCIIRHA